jgi:hypothetical protein
MKYGVRIELDKVRQLRYDLNALSALEDKLGVSITGLEDIQVGMRTIRSMLWAGLIHEDPEITEEFVGQYVGPGQTLGFMEAMECVAKALAEAFGEEPPENPTQAVPADGTGEQQDDSASAH